MTTTVAEKFTDVSKNELRLPDICVHDSSDIQFGSEIQHYGPLNVQQYVTGLPQDLAMRPEVGECLAKMGLMAAASSPGETPPPLTLQLQGSKDEGRRKFRLWWWGVGALIVTFLLLLFVLTLLLTPTVSETIPEQNPLSEETYNPFLSTLTTNVTLSGKLRIHPRDEWLAQPTNLSTSPTLAKYVLITETGGENCPTEALCNLQLVNTQISDKKLGLQDIAPTFLLGGDGYAYEGRGWDVHNQCTLNFEYDNNSVCISFIGSFATTRPNNKQILAAKQLIDQGILLEKINKNYVIYGTRQISTKISRPSIKLFEIIKTWPNWKPDIDNE